MADMHLEFARGGASFTAELYHLLSAGGVKENIVFSPFSIQTCIALAFLGAKGETADEIAKGLNFASNLAHEVSETFQFVLDKYHNSPLLKVANKVYAMHGNHLKPSYEAAIKKHFHSEAESINFSLNDAAAKSINAWVKAKTEGKITDLVTPDSFDDSTRLVLVNAMHFKGQWMHKFKERDTKKDDFWISQKQSVKVHYMCAMKDFGYASFPELECTALEMPYKDADLSMFVLLPQKRDGLEQLAEKLKTVNLVDLSAKLVNDEVSVMFPKFKVESTIDLVDKLKQVSNRTLLACSHFGLIVFVCSLPSARDYKDVRQRSGVR